MMEDIQRLVSLPYFHSSQYQHFNSDIKQHSEKFTKKRTTNDENVKPYKENTTNGLYHTAERTLMQSWDKNANLGADRIYCIREIIRTIIQDVARTT